MSEKKELMDELLMIIKIIYECQVVVDYILCAL